jgi:hypothetical protein
MASRGQDCRAKGGQSVNLAILDQESGTSPNAGGFESATPVPTIPLHRAQVRDAAPAIDNSGSRQIKL